MIHLDSSFLVDLLRERHRREVGLVTRNPRHFERIQGLEVVTY